MTGLNYTLQHLCLHLAIVLVMAIPSDGEERIFGFAQEGSAFLEQYCFGCHTGEQPAAGFALDSFPSDLPLIKNRNILERVLDMLTTRQMPPPDSHQPTLEELESFVAYVAAVLEHFNRTVSLAPRQITVRRLNTVEYKNTVRDLLGVDFDPTENFPADNIGYGFDNIGDVLTISPLLMERYLEAAEKIAERVILVNPPLPTKHYQSGWSLEPRHANEPDDRFRLLDPNAKVAWKTGPFTTKGAYLGFRPDAELIYRATLYVETGDQVPVEVALFVQGDALESVSSPDKLARLVGVDPKETSNIKILKIFKITSRDPKAPQTIEVLVNRIAHVEKVGIAMVKLGHDEPDAKLQIRTLWSEGPLDTRPASQRKILACTPDLSQAEQTREVLTRLLRRGYRRLPSLDEVEQLARFVELVQAGSGKWEVGIQQAIKIILCSPKFLFRLELNDYPQRVDSYLIDEFQLASRLSYFLWSSMPDDELLKLAEKKQLAVNLEAQIKRMLADPKSLELARNFGTQWLQIQRLENAAPDLERFPTFTHKLRDAMLKETELFLDSIFREDRSILNLIDADYTFLNRPLANHYGIADAQGNWMEHGVDRTEAQESGSIGKAKRLGGEAIKGSEFQRVFLRDASRGGILTHASVLTATSNPTRTSPVKRGRWVLEQVLGSPQLPPPPNVPELKEAHETGRGTTMRQRLEQHRKDPACAGCHTKMDPIGFALENYNAIGAFRMKEGRLSIDTRGELPDGTTFQGIAGLKQILKDRKEHFVRCLTEKMLTYALGRGLEYYDRPTVNRIVTQLESEGYRSSVLITEIVKSDPFRLRRGTRKE